MVVTKLSADENFLLFDNVMPDNISCGISTTVFGDARSNGKQKIFDDDKKLNVLQNTTKAKQFYKIIPNHSCRITYAIPNNRLENLIINSEALVWQKTGNQKKVCLLCPTADCPIIMLSNGMTSIIAHSGWWEIKEGIPERILEIFEIIDGQFDNLQFLIWPGISMPYYEVGKEFEKYFPGKIKDRRFGLAEQIREQILQNNINSRQIFIPDNFCSYSSLDQNSNNMFFSRRRGNNENNILFMTIS